MRFNRATDYNEETFAGSIFMKDTTACGCHLSRQVEQQPPKARSIQDGPVSSAPPLRLPSNTCPMMFLIVSVVSNIKVAVLYHEGRTLFESFITCCVHKNRVWESVYSIMPTVSAALAVMQQPLVVTIGTIRDMGAAPRIHDVYDEQDACGPSCSPGTRSLSNIGPCTLHPDSSP